MAKFHARRQATPNVPVREDGVEAYGVCHVAGDDTAEHEEADSPGRYIERVGVDKNATAVLLAHSMHNQKDLPQHA